MALSPCMAGLRQNIPGLPSSPGVLSLPLITPRQYTPLSCSQPAQSNGQQPQSGFQRECCFAPIASCHASPTKRTGASSLHSPLTGAPRVSPLSRPRPARRALKGAALLTCRARGQGITPPHAAAPVAAPAAAEQVREEPRALDGLAAGAPAAVAEAEAEKAASPRWGAGGAGVTGSVRKTRRVVITGMGVVSCLGLDPDTFYDNLLEGKSGVSEIQNFDASEFPTRIAGEIKEFDYHGYVHPKMGKRMDKYMQYLLTAGKKALENAGLGNGAGLDPLKCGILIGSAMGGMQIFSDAVESLRVSYRKMNPFCIPFVTTNMGSAMLAMDLGWMGPNYSISTACATSNHCLLSAAQHIQRGDADVMLSGGSDAPILPIGLGGFVACKALSRRNLEPQRASRPWDSERDGFVMGEGSGVLVLEELEHAKARGATIFAEFLGGHVNCDAYHMTDPHPEGRGVRLCIETALRNTGVETKWVNYVNAHATSTLAGDVQEYKAIVAALGDSPELKMNGTKSMVGHLLGAAGAVEAIATVQAIRTGWLHPTLNLENPDPALDSRHLVKGVKEPLRVKVALSNSFGFGGHNSSILFAPYHPDGVASAVAEIEQSTESGNGHAT